MNIVKNPHRQVTLRDGRNELVCYLPDHKLLREGNTIQLKDHPDPNRWWAVVHVSDHVRPKASIKQHWSNNI